MKFFPTVLAALFAGVSMATKGVDFSTPLSVSTFQCLKSYDYTFAIPRAWKSYGAFDSESIQNIANARAAGIPYVDVYMFPCRGQSATNQVNQLISSLGSANYGQIWLDIETNPSSGCSWANYGGASNCDYVGELIAAVRNKGKAPGIYASRYMWEQIMGSAGSCTKHTATPLWYAHYDGVASFSDWNSVSFGGWSKPNIKQYKGDVTVCGAGVDLSFY